MTATSRIILRMGQIIKSTAMTANNNDFALVGSTGGNLTDSPEPATLSCADSLLRDYNSNTEPAKQNHVL